MLPGLLLARVSFPSEPPSSQSRWGWTAAAATISLILMMLATALVGLGVSLTGRSMPAMAIVPISLFAGLSVWATWHSKFTASRFLPAINWPAASVAGLLIGFGLLGLVVGIRTIPDGTQQFHAWYNADWFKHIGHVHGLADYGVPARDIFGGGNPLHYYWLIYILPGAGTAAGGDAWAALATTNSITNCLFGILFYALIRRCCRSTTLALSIAVAALITITPAGFFVNLISGMNTQEFLATEIAPSGSALLATSGVIPQHTLAMSALMAWALVNLPSDNAARPMWLASLGALATLPAISTLLGTLLLVAYGLLRLCRSRQHAVLELVAMVLATVAVTFALGTIDIGNPASAIESPLLTNAPDQRPGWLLAVLAVAKMIGLTGVPAVIVFLAAARWRPRIEDEKAMFQLMLAIAGAAILGVVATQTLLTQRLAEETFIRATIPFSIAAAMASAWLVQKLWADNIKSKIGLALGLAFAVAVGLPAHYTRLVWTGNFGDVHTTSIALDDRVTLAALRKLSKPKEIVWQYPEKPALGAPKGGDAWTAIFAGRTVLNSERATDYAAARPFIELSERFFAGGAVEPPERVDWVYLSRALHPATYDTLVLRMRKDAGWRQRACYADACLFSRAPKTKP